MQDVCHFFIKMFCVPANLALKKLCYVLKCLLDTDAFLLSNNDHLDINLSSKHQKIKLLVSLLFCFLSLRLPQSSNFLNFWTTSQHYTPTFFFLDGGTSFDNQISYLRKNSKFLVVWHYISGPGNTEHQFQDNDSFKKYRLPNLIDMIWNTGIS